MNPNVSEQLAELSAEYFMEFREVSKEKLVSRKIVLDVPSLIDWVLEKKI